MQYDGLVLSGGSLRGLVQLGILTNAVEKGLDLKKIHTLVGTSVGSMIIVLLAIGYSPLDLFREIYMMQELIPKDAILKIKDIFKLWGVLSMKHIGNRIEELIDKILTTELCPPSLIGCNSTNLTLGLLYEKTGKRLLITTVNVSKMKLEILSHETHSQLRVVDAVSLSSNIPFVFRRLSYKGDYYIDGGLLNNFPIDLAVGCSKVLAISIGSDRSTEKIDSFFSYASNVFFVPLTNATEESIKNAGDNVDIIRLKVDYDLIKMSPSGEEKMNLFVKGYNGAKEYFDKLYPDVDDIDFENKYEEDNRYMEDEEIKDILT